MSRKQISKGFSLIEVTIALAIVAVSVVTLMGMIPQGLQTMQNAGDQAIYGRIHQQMISELLLTDWDAVDGVKKERFFDDQGIELDSSSDKRDQVYAARAIVPNGGERKPKSMGDGNFPKMRLPGGSPSPNVKSVIIEVAAASQPDFSFDEEANIPLISVYQTSITRLRKDATSN